MTAEELADAVGVSERELGMIGGGRRRPSSNRLLQITEALGMLLADLFK